MFSIKYITEVLDELLGKEYNGHTIMFFISSFLIMETTLLHLYKGMTTFRDNYKNDKTLHVEGMKPELDNFLQGVADGIPEHIIQQSFDKRKTIEGSYAIKEYEGYRGLVFVITQLIHWYAHENKIPYNRNLFDEECDTIVKTKNPIMRSWIFGKTLFKPYHL